MGSAASTPNRESSDNTSDNPWWQIENQILELNPNRMEEASSGDPNSSSSNRSESDQPQANETEETVISANNLECESSDGNGIATATLSSLNESENANSENCVESNCSSDAGANSNIEINDDKRGRSNERQQSLDEFKEELRIKREMRTNAIVELRSELSSLRQQLAHEKEINKQLIEERSKENLCEICSSIYKSIEQPNVVHDAGVVVGCGGGAAAAPPSYADLENAIRDVYNNGNIKTDARTSQITPNVTLRTQLAEAQLALQNANAEILRISSELTATQQQAKSLKEVIKMSKEIIAIRETELSQVNSQVSQRK